MFVKKNQMFQLPAPSSVEKTISLSYFSQNLEIRYLKSLFSVRQQILAQ